MANKLPFCNFTIENKVEITAETFLITASIYRLKEGEAYRDISKYLKGLEGIINFVNGPKFWYKNTVFRIYFDQSIVGDEGFVKLKDTHGKDGSKIQFVQYQCPAYLDREKEQHYGTFGTLVRMMPIYDRQAYKLLFVSDIDFSYGEMLMWFEYFPQKILNAKYKDGSYQYKWLFVNTIGYEYKYDLYGYNDHLDGTALANFYTRTYDLDTKLLEDFLQEATDSDSGLNKIMQRMRELSRKRKAAALEQTRYQEGGFSYGIDEIFLNRYLIPNLFKVKRPQIGQILLSDRLRDYPLEMIDLEESSLTTVLEVFKKSFKAEFEPGLSKIEQLNLVMNWWQRLFFPDRSQNLVIERKGILVPSQRFLQIVTIIKTLMLGIEQAYNDGLVKFTDYRYFTNMKRHHYLNSLSLHGYLTAIKRPEDLNRNLFVKYYLTHIGINPVKQQIFDQYLFHRINGSGCYFIYHDQTRLLLTVPKTRLQLQVELSELFKNHSAPYYRQLSRLITRPVGSIELTRNLSVESQYNPFDKIYPIKAPCPYHFDHKLHAVVLYNVDLKKYDFVANAILNTKLSARQKSDLVQGLKNLRQDTEELAKKIGLYPRHFFPTDILYDRKDPTQCRWVYYDMGKSKRYATYKEDFRTLLDLLYPERAEKKRAKAIADKADIKAEVDETESEVESEVEEVHPSLQDLKLELMNQFTPKQLVTAYENPKSKVGQEILSYIIGNSAEELRGEEVQSILKEIVEEEQKIVDEIKTIAKEKSVIKAFISQSKTRDRALLATIRANLTEKYGITNQDIRRELLLLAHSQL